MSSNGPNLKLLINATTGESYPDALRALLRGIDVLVMPAVISRTLSTPPGSPANGDRYIVGSSPAGGWSSFGAGHFVSWTTDDPSNPSGVWFERVPETGWVVYSIADSAMYVFNGTAWVALAGGGGGSSLASLSDVTISSPADGQVLVYDSASSTWENKGQVRAICFVIDGGGSVPSTGVYGQVSVPFACTVIGWNLTADASGSAVIDVLRSTGAGFPSTSSIAGTDKPTLSSAQRAHDTTLSGWGSTALAQFDELQVDLSSVATCQRLNLTVYVSVP